MEVEAPRQDVAQRLSPWLDAFAAVTLSAAHQSVRDIAREPAAPAQQASARAVQAHFQKVRTALAEGITEACETGTSYAPFRRRYVHQQRHMELKVGQLRDQVRQALSRASPRLKQLATLDAALDPMLAQRGQKLLATVPDLLERRFEQLRKAHASEPADAAVPGEPALQPPLPPWLDTFGREMQAVQLAELDVRLEPVAGLIAAFTHEATQYP